MLQYWHLRGLLHFYKLATEALQLDSEIVLEACQEPYPYNIRDESCCQGMYFIINRPETAASYWAFDCSPKGSVNIFIKSPLLIVAFMKESRAAQISQFQI